MPSLTSASSPTFQGDLASPHSVALMQLRFTLLTVTSSQRDLHPHMCAHAGRTKKSPSGKGWALGLRPSEDGFR